MEMNIMNKRNLIIALALLVLAAIVAFVAWNRHQTRQLHDTTLEKISAATRDLRTAADPKSSVQIITAGAARVDGDLTALRATATSASTLALNAASDPDTSSTSMISTLVMRCSALEWPGASSSFIPIRCWTIPAGVRAGRALAARSRVSETAVVISVLLGWGSSHAMTRN